MPVRFIVSKYSFFVIPLIFTIVMLSSFRWEGLFLDTENYIAYLDNDNLIDRFNVEYTFVIIAEFIKFFGFDHSLLFFVYASFSLFVKYKLFSKFNDKKFIFFFYFFSFGILQDFIQIRVGLAISLFLISVYYISNGNLLRFFAFFFLSASFHYSLLITFPFVIFNHYILNRDKLVKLYLLILPIVFLVFYIYAGSIISNAISIFFPSLLSKFENYSDIEDLSSVNLFSVKMLFIYFYVILLGSRFFEVNNFYRLSLLLVINGILLMFAFKDNLGLALRLSDPFFSLFVFLVSSVREDFKETFLLRILFPAILFGIFSYYNYMIII